MKRIYLVLVFLVIAYLSYSQTSSPAGPDKLICSGSSVTIGILNEDPQLCYSWKASPVDPAVINSKTSKITVSPTQTTTYTLTIIGQNFSSNIADQVVVEVITNSNVSITWDAPDYTVQNTASNPVTTEKPFIVEYRACPDIGNNVWRLRVIKVRGNVKIDMFTGGYRNPLTSPPVSQVEAIDAINTMKDYYLSGRGNWHTEAASRAHEEYHYSEWKCASEHYWTEVENCLEQFTVPYNLYPDEASAIVALKALGANAKINDFQGKARAYWFTLGDSGGDRPYAAGQLALNAAIISVQTLAATNGWVVPQGTNSPSTANPCYQPFSPFVLIPCP